LHIHKASTRNYQHETCILDLSNYSIDYLLNDRCFCVHVEAYSLRSIAKFEGSCNLVAIVHLILIIMHFVYKRTEIYFLKK